MSGRYLHEKPTQEQLIGLWSLDLEQSTIENVRKIGKKGASIRLDSDGTASVVDFPYFVETDSAGVLLSAVGRWELQAVQDFHVVEIRFATDTGLRDPQYLVFNLLDETSAFRAYQCVGDPDEGRGVVVVKTNERVK